MGIQIFFVAAIGILGVLMIVGAMLLLNRQDSPEERDRKAKEQIIAEMLASAATEEERAGILAMSKGESSGSETVPSPDESAEAPEQLYGLDAEKGDILDKLIVAHLQSNAESAEAGEDADEDADEEAAAESEAPAEEAEPDAGAETAEAETAVTEEAAEESEAAAEEPAEETEAAEEAEAVPAAPEANEEAPADKADALQELTVLADIFGWLAHPDAGEKEAAPAAETAETEGEAKDDGAAADGGKEDSE